MPIEFNCSQCNKQLRTPDETAGKKAKCPQCGAVTQIPYAAAFTPLAEFAPQDMPTSHAASSSPGQVQPGQIHAGPATDSAPFNFNPYQSPITTATATRQYARTDVRNVASRGTRFIGRFIDNLILFAGAVPGLFVLFTTDRPVGRGDGDDILFEPTAGALLFWGGILAVAIVNWILIVQSGQSIAKKMLGMRIVRVDGSLPGFVNGVILRSWVPNVIGAIPFFGSLFGFANALAIFGSESRCIHDHIASTRVINA
jgi:uncharacterized RDD family membrane protein YckC/phage FluMu protein Com